MTMQANVASQKNDVQNKNYRGLQNLGNTCYMNSYTQSLFMTKEFRFRLFNIELNSIVKGHENQQIQEKNKQNETKQDSQMEIETEEQNKISEIKNEETQQNNNNDDEKQMQIEDQDQEKKQQEIEEIKKQNHQKNISQLERQKNFATVFQLQKLFTLLYQSKRPYINPQSFKNVLPDMFKFSSAQHDASEYGRMFLEQLEQSLKYTDDKNLLDDYFIGELNNFYNCLDCNNTKQSKEKFMDISLTFDQEQELQNQQQQEKSIKEETDNKEINQDINKINNYTTTNNNEISVLQLLKNSFKQEIFQGENAYHCGFCDKKSQKTIKSMNLQKLPNYVILTINRFQFDRKLLKKIKIMQKVDIQESIDLQDYLDPMNNNQNELNQKKMDLEQNQQLEQSYQLYSILIHRGKTAEFGHYYSFSRENSTNDSKWIMFDDSSITQMSGFQEIQKFLSTAKDDTPYLLFYQKKQIAEKFDEDEKNLKIKLNNTLQKILQNDNDQYINELESGQKALNALSNFKVDPNFFKYNKRNFDDDDDEGGNFGNNLGNGNNREIF